MHRLEPPLPADGPTTRRAGFSLLELLVTLTVASVLLTVGVPSFYRFIQNNRATTHTNDLVMALNLARSEAMQRGEAVVACSSADGATCGADDDWSTGWIVREPAPDGEVVRTWPARSGGNEIVAGNGVSEVPYDPRGFITIAGAEFDVVVPGCTGEQARTVRVNVAGRISVTRQAC